MKNLHNIALKRLLWRFLTLAFMLVIVWSCKKNTLKGNTTAAVYVFESGSDKPIEGAKVYFYGGKTSGSGLWGSSSLKLLETYTTDANGFVHIDFKQKDYKDEGYSFYTLRAYAPNYYVNKTEYDLKLKQDNEITIELGAEAYLRVHVKNVKKIYAHFFIDPYGTPGGGGGGGFGGYNIDTNTISRTLGNYNVVLSYGYCLDANFTDCISIKDTIYCPAHDTTDFYIEY